MKSKDMGTAVNLIKSFNDLSVLAGSRNITDGATTAELALQRDFSADLEPALADLYRLPLQGGLSGLPEDREDLEAYILNLYDDPATQLPLKLVLERYVEQAANIGGQIGLDVLGANDEFNLEDEGLIAELDAHSESLVLVDSDMSLTRTTANEMAYQISARRAATETAESVILAELAAWINLRNVVRSIVIADTETVRITRRSMLWTYAFNGITSVIHNCEADVADRCSSQLCPPLCGKRFPINSGDVYANIPGGQTIPLHPYCRCWYEPERSGWVLPALLWTGFAISLLG